MRKSEIINVPTELIKQADRIRDFANLKHRTEAMHLMNGMSPMIDRIETKRLPKSKRRQVVIFGRWVFEL